MNIRRTIGLWTLTLLASLNPAAAQSSASYRLEESTFRNGGSTPAAAPASPGYRLSLSAIGGFGRRGLSSSSFRADGCFTCAYGPPGEVAFLDFADGTTLSWTAEPSAGRYNLYRDRLSTLSSLSYGNCFQQQLSGTTFVDADPVPATDGFFYLVTVENRLAEEGPKGADGSGTARGGTACP
ncbi:hypothetical protein ABI59_15560 [Acidobacteria bacterium Mor1]|nr:hypothetical protein ABI59_15560 [Acidobacteria bacterium Mor1]